MWLELRRFKVMYHAAGAQVVVDLVAGAHVVVDQLAGAKVVD